MLLKALTKDRGSKAVAPTLAGTRGCLLGKWEAQLLSRLASIVKPCLRNGDEVCKALNKLELVRV